MTIGDPMPCSFCGKYHTPSNIDGSIKTAEMCKADYLRPMQFYGQGEPIPIDREHAARIARVDETARAVFVAGMGRDSFGTFGAWCSAKEAYSYAKELERARAEAIKEIQ